MKARYINSPVEKACSMVGITDDDIRSWSSMEITETALDWDENGRQMILKGGAFAPEFSGLDLRQAPFSEIVKNDRMGHIELPFPIINIEYIRGKEPVLPKRLGLSRKTVEDIMYMRSGVAISDFVSDADHKSYHCGDIISFTVFSYNPDQGLIGADAIEYLMKKRKIDLPGAVLHTLPVLPVCFLLGDRKKDQLCATFLECSYYSVIRKKCLLEQLLPLQAPDIIIWNERRNLQECADALIRNGAHGPVVVEWNGYADRDLAHEYLEITGGASVRPCLDHFEIPHLPTAQIEKLADMYWNTYDQMPDDNPYDKTEDTLESYDEEIITLLAPLVSSVADCFRHTGVSKERLTDIAMNYVSCSSRGIDGGFQASVLSAVCHNSKHSCKIDYERLAKTMMQRITYYLDNCIAFSDTEAEKKGELA